MRSFLPSRPRCPSRLRTVAASLFIGGYLSVMLLGVAAHAVGYGQNTHPLMYYVVWDMFCGWSAHSTRTHVLAEGEGGTWYDASTGPWDAFRPYGELPRIDYDVGGTHGARLALNVLKQTEHEPIRRLVVVEESWPKKFNLPADLWARRYGTEKKPVSFYAVRHVVAGGGTLVDSGPAWADAETGRHLAAVVKAKAAADAKPLRVVGFSDPATY